MKKFEFITNENEINLFDIVKDLSLYDPPRKNLHSAGSSLNLMLLKIEADAIDRRFHWNVDRDEIFCVLEGQVRVEQKISGKLTTSLIGGSMESFFSIAANVAHRIISVTPHSYILEIIGGKFEQGATKYEG